MMEENDRKMSKRELDYIVSQLQQAQGEAAATIAIPPARTLKGTRKILLSIRSWMVGLLIGVMVSLAAILAWYTFSQKSETMKSGSAVERIQNLATLATAQGHIKTILSKEDNQLFGKTINFNFPGSKRTLFLVVPADITAGVDLKNVTSRDVSIDNDSKTININLPHAAIIQDPSIDFKNIKTFSNEGLFRSDVNWDEGFELADLAKQQIREEALQSGLLKTAEDNTKLALQDFFKNLDYNVNVNFK